MKIETFGVETWMNAHENHCRFNLAESCVDSITLDGLLELADRPDLMGDLLPRKLTYGAIEGSVRLRTAIASLYPGKAADDVLVTHGAIGANALLYETLVEPGDEIVSVVPTYQQHTSLAESYGATVRRLPLRAETGYQLDLEALAALVTPRTRLIALTNPNNPTGAVLDRSALERIAGIAESNDAFVLCDEVYRGIDQDTDTLGPSIAELSPKGIAVGSMSKAFALAGLRLGWIVAPAAVLAAAMIRRDYTTISVGMIDDHLASIALEHADALLRRNRAIVRNNLALLDTWVAGEALISYARPAGGTVTLLRYGIDLPSETVCKRLLDETGVLLMPGAALGMEGTVRIGFGNGTAALTAGLAATSQFLSQFGG